MNLIPEISSQYESLLEELRDALKSRDRASANWLQARRDDLREVSDAAALRAHAAQTSRSMGGMGSLGEVVLMGKDPKELRLFKELYAICKFILSS